jgi:hypothetical protein
MSEAEAFEYAARYRTRRAIEAMEDRFEADEVLVYWRYWYLRHDDVRGWRFRQPGTFRVRSYDRFGGEPIRRDELFERIEGPRPVVVGAAAGDVAAIELAVTAAPGDADAMLDRELAAELALRLDRSASFTALLANAGLDHDARVRLLHVAAQQGRASAISGLLASGVGVHDAAPLQLTALGDAVRYAQVEAVAALLDAGADPDRTQSGGTTPRDFARDPHIIDLLNRRR